MRQTEAIPARRTTAPEVPPRVVPLRKAAWRSVLTSYSFILPIAAFGLFLLVYPVLYSLALSFRDATVETYVSGDMPFIGFNNYAQSLADSTFWQALENTIIFTFVSILFQFTIGFLLALFLPLPAWRWVPVLARAIRKRFAALPGACRICGYDLRATPHQCPECGTVVLSA